MQKAIDPKAIRLANLRAAVLAIRSVTNDRFGSDDDLKEIGRLTMFFAKIEESLALFCEVLLLRPELGGFHHPAL
jgi:hypothetical protein